jgi:hypothetical protein
MVLGIVHRAIYFENRKALYPFNYEWMDHLLNAKARVCITVINPAGLPNLRLDEAAFRAQPAGTAWKPPTPEAEAEACTEILYTRFPSAIAEADNSRYMEPHSTAIDAFLTHNPCWVPLREPCAYNCSQSGGRHSHAQQSAAAAAPGSLASASASQVAAAYVESAVLVRLPPTYASTCRFYTALVMRQFPSSCKYDLDNMIVKYPHNIGWSHTLHDVQGTLRDSMKEGYSHKVVVMPRADFFDGITQTFALSNGTMITRDRSKWYWANAKTCPEEQLLFDPWACNFLPITNCSSRKVVLDIPAPLDKGIFGTEYHFVTQLGITDETRRLNRDGAAVNMMTWANARLITFLQRPHARMRQMIRRSVRSISKLPFAPRTHSGTHNPSGSGGAGPLHNLDSISPAHSFSAAVGASSRLPCVAMHVRHGDSRMDHRARDMKTDRSFDAHVAEARDILQAIGTNIVFLLTDNSTLHRLAAQQYPEISWFMQRRPIKEHYNMYRVDNEDDIQLELSHVIADVMVAGSCAAMVGCMDSGVTTQARDMSVGLSRNGAGLYEGGLTVDVLNNRERRQQMLQRLQAKAGP